MSILLSYNRYEFIKGEVVALFERYEVKTIPINGYALASKMGITLIPFSSLSEKKLCCAKILSNDGFYVEGNDGRDFIFYNDLLTPQERINMTILHEIGHCVLDHVGNSPYEEAEAQFFAKYAIAPPPLINCIHPSSSIEIASYFHLSKSAASNSFDYYQKWMFYGDKSLKDYEMKLLSLFHDDLVLEGGA